MKGKVITNINEEIKIRLELYPTLGNALCLKGKKLELVN